MQGSGENYGQYSACDGNLFEGQFPHPSASSVYNRGGVNSSEILDVFADLQHRPIGTIFESKNAVLRRVWGFRPTLPLCESSTMCFRFACRRGYHVTYFSHCRLRDRAQFFSSAGLVNRHGFFPLPA